MLVTFTLALIPFVIAGAVYYLVRIESSINSDLKHQRTLDAASAEAHDGVDMGASA